MASKRSTWGSVQQEPGGTYTARWTHRGRRITKGGFTRRRDAQNHLDQVHAEILGGRWRAPEKRPTTVGELYHAHLERVRPGTAKNYRSTWKRHLQDTWDDIAVIDIRPADVHAWHTARRAAGAGPRALSSAYQLLRAVLQTAVEQEIVDRNPCRIRGAGATNAKRRGVALTVEQLVAAAASASCPPRYRAAVLVAGLCGLRFGEWSELRLRDVDLAARTIQVDRAQYAGVIGPPKTAAGRRTVQMPRVVADALRKQIREYVGTLHPDALLLGTRAGTHVSSGNWAKTWRRIVEAEGLPPESVPHDLRRSALTLAAQHGATLAELMAMAGHANPDAAVIYQAAAQHRMVQLADAADAAHRAAKRRVAGQRAKKQ